MTEQIAESLCELIGGTPLVRPSRYGQDLPGEIVGKLELRNPLASVKDRIGWARIRQAQDTWRLRDHDLYTPAHMETLPLKQRRGNQEVELGLAEEDIEINARRCYLCCYKFEIDQDKCIRCGNCHRACPTYAIPTRKADVVRGPIE